VAPRLTNGHSQIERPGGRRGSLVPLTLAALGVVGLVWLIQAQRQRDAEKPADRLAGTSVASERLGALTGSSHLPHLVGPASSPSGRRAFEPAGSVEAPQQPDGLVESSASKFESAGEDPVLQALDEADDETRLQRLEEAVYSGAEIPIERMHEVLATDPSDKVREFALTTLTGYTDAGATEVRAVAEGALGNSSLAVRAQASRILAQMDELERIHRESLLVQPEK
jgi:hypothetical protein